MASHTMPLLEQYAKKHLMDFECVNLSNQSGIPASWMKIPNILDALEFYDWVLWVDCDVVVIDDSDNLIDEVSGIHGLVKHTTECGEVPNCGVWATSKEMSGVLTQVWRDGLQRYIDHPWWEQAAILEMLGYAVQDGPFSLDSGPTELRNRTTFLDSRWNYHFKDIDRKETHAFFHATGAPYEARMRAVADACDFVKKKRPASSGID